MPDFTPSNKRILIQPGDSKVPYCFTFTVCSSETANDGALPYDTTISSYTVSAHKHDSSDTSATTDIISSSSRSNFIITVYLKYPSTLGAGRYDLKFLLTLSNAAVLEFDFNRVFVRDV